jgi:hypothetical protein
MSHSALITASAASSLDMTSPAYGRGTKPPLDALASIVPDVHDVEPAA